MSMTTRQLASNIQHMFQKLDGFLSDVTLLPDASAQICRHDP